MVARNHVAAFIKSFYRRTDMFMLEIKPDFIKGFAAYLSTKAGLHNGTIWEKCMWLKGVVMCVHFNGLIPKKTFAQFHISPNVTVLHIVVTVIRQVWIWEEQAVSVK